MVGVRNIVGMDGEPASADAEDAPDVAELSTPTIRRAQDLAADLDAQAPLELTDDAVYTEDDPVAQPSKWPMVLHIIVIGLGLGWTGLCLWLQRGAFTAGIAPSALADALVQYSVPLILLASITLLAQRNSAREAAKFGAIARSLSDESTLLEARVLHINSELSLAREFLANQSHELESIGRTASKRLSGHAEHIREAIADSDTRMQTIGTVSESAAANLEKIRGQLPVVASSAKDVTNQIGNAGRAAQTHTENMVQAFRRINEFGQASEIQVNKLQARTDTALASMTDGVEGLVGQVDWHLARLAKDAESHTAQITDSTAAAYENLRSNGGASVASLAADIETAAQAMATNLTLLSSQGASTRKQLADSYQSLLGDVTGQTDAIVAQVEDAAGRLGQTAHTQLAEIDTATGQLADTLNAQQTALVERLAVSMDKLNGIGAETRRTVNDSLNAFDGAMSHISERRSQEGNALSQMVVSLNNLIDDISERIALLDSEGGVHTAKLAFALTALNENIDRLTQNLAVNQISTTQMMHSSELLSTSLTASAAQLASDLPQALDALEAKLQAGAQALVTTRTATDALAQHYAAFDDTVSATGLLLHQLIADMAALHDQSGAGLLNQKQALHGLIDTLRTAHAETDALSASTQDRLSAAIAHVRSEIVATSAAAAQAISGSIAGTADILGQQSEAALDRVLQGKAAQIVDKLDAAVSHAVGAANQASIHLRDQLLKVDELAANLEQRVAQARENAEEQTDNAFARRVALITESLNSTAIDVAKILSNDVTDTAWAAYLKGDRGVFTRRAVRLLDAGEMREILTHYENDAEFQGHVNRYIHDFEAMLRNLLSTRDGGAVGVTLLSSDIGKLYVALAQAIERLRT